MKKIKINLENFSRKDVDTVVDELRRGGVVVSPSDTIYGFSCVATDKGATEKLYEIKEMENTKISLVLMKGFGMIRRYCFLSPKQYALIKKSFQEERPTTFILKSRGNILENYISPSLGVAIRIPKKSDFLMKLLKRVDLPLASTSLNVTGKEPVDEVSDLENIFKEKRPDLVVDAGKIADIKSSRILDIRNVNDVKVIRE